MRFKLWLESQDWIFHLIGDQFPLTLHNYGAVKIFSSELPTGQKVTFSVTRDQPNIIQISFTVDKAVRKGYGIESNKDPASNQILMPGSLELMRKLKEVVSRLKSNGYKVTYNAIDSRRKKFYSKLFG